jgi:hypothetical protein
VIANNALYCAGTNAIKFPQGAGGTAVAGNAVVGALNGADMGTLDGIDEASAFLDAGGMALYPAGGGPLVDAGTPDYSAARDFNCLEREPGAPEIGAYDWSDAANPGWMVQAGFKVCAEEPGGTTGGTTGSGTSDSGDPTNGTGDPSAGTDSSGGATSSGGGSTGGESDASAGGTTGSSSAGSSSGTGSAATSDSESAGEDGDDGCGCTLGGAGGTASPWLLLLCAGLRRRRAGLKKIDEGR